MPQTFFPEAREATKRLLWSSDLRRGITSSVVFHIVLAGSVFAFMADWHLPADVIHVDDSPIVVFDIAGPKTDSEEVSNIPEIAPPTVVEDSEGPVVDEPVAEMAVKEGGSGLDYMIWTPPPPGAEARDMSSDTGASEPPPKMEFIDLPKDGVAPTLVAYDMGKFGGAEALSEAARLQGEGSLKMLVYIDEEGAPTACSTVSTSGSNVLDDLGCNLVMTYRYEPGKDARGRPVVSSAYELLEWSSDKRSRQDPGMMKRTIEDPTDGTLEVFEDRTR